MGETLQQAVEAMKARLEGSGLDDGTACFVLRGEGVIVVEAGAVRAGTGDEQGDVTLSAEVEVFRAILEGRLSPTSAFLSGKLSIEGDMGLALRLASAMA